MLETEILSEMTSEEFHKKLNELTQKFGQPKYKKRVGLQATDYNYNDLDTRIRITNGQPQLVQKVGTWNSESREEIEIDLPKDPQFIFKLYKTLINLIKSDKVETCIIQTENYIFLTDKVEIKLTRQFGKKEVFNFEVEALNQNVDLIDVCNELNLEIKEQSSSAEFWRKWNREVNLYTGEMRDEELFKLVSQALEDSKQ